MSVALSQSERASIDQSIENASGLPNDCYTNSDWVQVERDTVFSNTWTCIGYGYDLVPGTIRPMEFLGLPLLIVCDEFEHVQVFHNVCRHRGHRLVECAKEVNGFIQCPYHGWSYGLDGSLKRTPHFGGFGVHNYDGFDQSKNGLWRIPCATWLGMVFINLGGVAPDFACHIQPLEHRWSEFTGIGGLSSLRPTSEGTSVEIEVNANWKLIVENYCESYHLPFVHPGLNEYSPVKDHYNIVAGEWGGGQGTRNYSFPERAGTKLPKHSNWPSGKKRFAEYIALYPNVLLGLHVDHLFSVILHPLAHDRTLERIQIYCVGDESSESCYVTCRQLVLDEWRKVLSEDIVPIEGMQRGRNSYAFDGGVFSPKLEISTHHFHRWIAARYPVEIKGSEVRAKVAS